VNEAVVPNEAGPAAVDAAGEEANEAVVPNEGGPAAANEPAKVVELGKGTVPKKEELDTGAVPKVEVDKEADKGVVDPSVMELDALKGVVLKGVVELGKPNVIEGKAVVLGVVVVAGANIAVAGGKEVALGGGRAVAVNEFAGITQPLIEPLAEGTTVGLRL